MSIDLEKLYTQMKEILQVLQNNEVYSYLWSNTEDMANQVLTNEGETSLYRALNNTSRLIFEAMTTLDKLNQLQRINTHSDVMQAQFESAISNVEITLQIIKTRIQEAKAAEAAEAKGGETKSKRRKSKRRKSKKRKGRKSKRRH